MKTREKQQEEEKRNVAITALKDRTQIGGAIVAAGRVDFPVTAGEAKELEALGLVRIDGIFQTEQGSI